MNNLYYPNYQTCKVPEVNGMNGANAYQIGVNSSVLLLDTNLPIVYLKQTDGGGYATVTAFDLVAHKDAKINELQRQLDNLGTVKYPMSMAYNAGNSPFCNTCGCC